MSYQLPVSRMRGYTLMELMMVVVIVAILAAIALPSYQEYVIRANRSAAQQFMMEIATREEQYRLDRLAYTAELTEATGLNLTLPDEVNGNYTIAIAVPEDGTTYQITATAVGRQASDGDLTLNSVGDRGPEGKWKK